MSRFFFLFPVRVFERILDRQLDAALAPIRKALEMSKAQDDALAAAVTNLQTSVTNGLTEITTLLNAAQNNGVDDPNVAQAITGIGQISDSLNAGVAAAQAAMNPPVSGSTA